MRLASDELDRQADALMAMVGDGATVVAGCLSAEPRYLMRALCRRAEGLAQVDLAAGMFLGDYDFLSAGSIRFRTWFPPGTLGQHRAVDRRIEYLPVGWAQVVDYLTERLVIDVLLIQVSAADDEGYHSFGTSASYVAPAAGIARRVIAEVNHAMPRTFGARIHSSRLDGVVDVDYPVPAFPQRPSAALDERIARNVSDLIADERTLQVGVGSIPDAVVRRLAFEGRRGMRFHGALPASVIALADCGGLAPQPGAITVCEALGDRDLYDFIDGNESVRMVGADETHAARRLVAVPRLTCLNSALSVDLFGQVNTEYLDGHQAGAVGGAVDFSGAATWSGNQGIVALRSTARADTVSRIVPVLESPTVSLPRHATQFVVTEHGVADLRDKTVEERRRAIAMVAHPAFRSALASA